MEFVSWFSFLSLREASEEMLGSMGKRGLQAPEGWPKGHPNPSSWEEETSPVCHILWHTGDSWWSQMFLGVEGNLVFRQPRLKYLKRGN